MVLPSLWFYVVLVTHLVAVSALRLSLLPASSFATAYGGLTCGLVCPIIGNYSICMRLQKPRWPHYPLHTWCIYLTPLSKCQQLNCHLVQSSFSSQTMVLQRDFKGTLSNKSLFDLVLCLKRFEFDHGIKIHFIHISGK
jgi:hypothetical protein